MTGLAANVASLATSLGAVASNVTRLVAVIAALHGKATGIVATLRAAARHVTSLVAIVTTQLWPLLQKHTCSKTIFLSANLKITAGAPYASSFSPDNSCAQQRK